MNRRTFLNLLAGAALGELMKGRSMVGWTPTRSGLYVIDEVREFTAADFAAISDVMKRQYQPFIVASFQTKNLFEQLIATDRRYPVSGLAFR